MMMIDDVDHVHDVDDGDDRYKNNYDDDDYDE